jgi:hypothetical protein
MNERKRRKREKKGKEAYAPIATRLKETLRTSRGDNEGSVCR